MSDRNRPQHPRTRNNNLIDRNKRNGKSVSSRGTLIRSSSGRVGSSRVGSGGSKKVKKVSFGRSVFRWLVWSFMIGVILFSVFFIGLFTYYSRDLPDLSKVSSYRDKLTSYIHSRDGYLLQSFSLENRNFTDIAEIPNLVKTAFISAEDSTFYSNSGIDATGILNAIITDLKYLITGKGKMIGASTITQQVVKNILLTSDRTIARKIKEIILSLQITKIVSKNKILELYLNHIYLGGGSYGVNAASKEYFGKTLAELEIHEMALIAAMPKAPSSLDPRRYPEKALARRNWVLLQMRTTGHITEEEYMMAVASEIVVKERKVHYAKGGHGTSAFTSYVKSLVSAEYGSDVFFSGGLHIYTTLDLETQVYLFSAFRKNLKKYTKKYEYSKIASFPALKMDEEWCRTFNVFYKKFNWQIDAQIKRALIIKKDKKTMTVGMSDCSLVDIKFSTMSWVKLPRGVRRLGSFFKVGDVVPIEDVNNNAFTVENLRSLHGVINEDSFGGESDSVEEEEAVKSKKKSKYRLSVWPKVNGGSLVANPKNGEVLAMVGDFFDTPNGFNRATGANRQLGSTVKPFLYTVALENGYLPNSILIDEVISFDDWKPKNHSKDYLGAITLRVAVERSRNIPAVRMGELLGASKVISRFKDFNILTKDVEVNDLSVVLGSFETTVEKLVVANSSFANGGRSIPTQYILKIQDSDGRVIFNNNAKCNDCSKEDSMTYTTVHRGSEIIKPEIAYQMLYMLEGVVQNGTARRAKWLSKSGIAGKTGTTNESRDSWFVGLTKDISFAAYAGYDAPKTLGHHEYGATIALPIFVDFMKKAVKKYPIHEFSVPKGIEFVEVDYHSGLKPSYKTSATIYEAFKTEDIPYQSSAVSNDEVYASNAKASSSSGSFNRISLTTKRDSRAGFRERNATDGERVDSIISDRAEGERVKKEVDLSSGIY